MKLSELHPYEQNAKKHTPKQVEQIARSIKEFGFNQPIVVDKNNEIIVGHGRYYAAQKLGLQEVPTIKPFALYKELRFEVSNGRTLCVPCHKRTNTYGMSMKYQSGQKAVKVLK